MVVWQPLVPGTFQEFDFATLRYRIVIGEGTKEGFFKALENSWALRCSSSQGDVGSVGT